MHFVGKIQNCSDNRTVYLNEPGVARCSNISWLAMTLFFFYILITPIMLINLLIAIFRLYSMLRPTSEWDCATSHFSLPSTIVIGRTIRLRMTLHFQMI